MKRFLKTAAIAGAALMPFPLLVFAVLAETRKFSASRAAALLLFGAVAVAFGYALDLLASKIKNAFIKQAALILTRAVALGSGLTALFFAKTGGFGSAELAVFMIALSYCCFTGAKSRAKRFSEIHSVFMLGFYTIISVAAELFRGAFAPEAANAKTALILAFIAEYAIAALLLNQTNIEKQINRRLDIRALIPKNLRAFNVSLIALVAAAFALIYLLGPVIKGAVLFAVKSAARLIAAVMSLSPQGVTGAQSVDVQPADYAPPPADSPVFGIILSALLTVMTVYALFKLRLFIFELIKSAVRRVIALFKPRESACKPVAVYEDYYEDVVFAKRKKRGSRALKDHIKLYGKERDPIAKMRLSYKIFLLWLVGNHKEFTPSDTVEECFERFGLIDDNYRDAYCGVRYGGDSGEDCAELADKMVERFIK